MCPLWPEPTSHLPPHHVTPVCHRAPALGALGHTSHLHWLSSFTHGNVYVSVLFSQIIPPSPSPTESKRLFFTSVSPLLPCMWDCQYHLSRFHIYLLAYGVCLDGSLTPSLLLLHLSSSYPLSYPLLLSKSSDSSDVVQKCLVVLGSNSFRSIFIHPNSSTSSAGQGPLLNMTHFL